MNAVEIEAAVSDLAAEPFDAAEFPFEFLRAFDKKDTTLRRLRKGDSNRTDIPGAVLLQSSIHLSTCAPGETHATLARLKASPKTVLAKARFVLATDGITLEAEDLTTGEAIASDYPAFPAHFGFFLPLAGISTVREIKDNPIDVRATGRLNKLYVELLTLNPDWAGDARRHDLNHFLARLIFCFFAEDTDIFRSRGLFTSTVEQMSLSDGSNTHTVIETLFRAMNVRAEDRAASGLPLYAGVFPYVNGGLFSGSTDVPRFNRIARSYLLQAGALSWREINPDIFGSMIQAVADDEERGALGMHYTSVPNILKVLNPLFLDELRAQLEAAGDNGRMLLNLRKRMSRIRVFDPACGSGNFLVIAYKQMRSIEAEIDKRLGETPDRSIISNKNFRGIEIRDFAAEIARLALVISEYQANVVHLGSTQAKLVFLPLNQANWITCGNALELDWSALWPLEGGVKLHSNDLFQTPLNQTAIDFENESGETFICGNPPYKGAQWQTELQKQALGAAMHGWTSQWRIIDYVAGWFAKAATYAKLCKCKIAFVSTKSICQGRQVDAIWKPLQAAGFEIVFAQSAFKWSNLAANKAGVTVIILCIQRDAPRPRSLITMDVDGSTHLRLVQNINAYLVAAPNAIISPRSKPVSALSDMSFGNMPNNGGRLLLTSGELRKLPLGSVQKAKFIKPVVGSAEFVQGLQRYCIWVSDADFAEANLIPSFSERFQDVRRARLSSKDGSAKALAERPYQFREMHLSRSHTIAVPAITSERRAYLPSGLLSSRTVVTNKIYALYDAPIWQLSLLVSTLHLSWIGTVCGRMRTDFSYSNTLGWNTFPVPSLTEQNKVDLTRCAEDILLAREAHFPATIADLYDPDAMPDNLRAAHDANDETLERIYIGRRFRNDTERLEKLFEMYTKMTAGGTGALAAKRTRKAKTKADSSAALRNDKAGLRSDKAPNDKSPRAEDRIQ